MSESVSFIHCADLHIDSPFKGLMGVGEKLFKQIHESTYASLDRLVQVAIEKQVDFILIVGDLFDSEQQSMKAQTRLKKAFEKLEHHEIHVYLSYGNHDFMEGRVFDIDFPSNVHVFESDQVETKIYDKDGSPLVSIHGFSYLNRAIYENKAEQFHISKKTPLHIGMLHGSINTSTGHDVYAPFQLTDLTEKPFHYWALGHIHKRQVLKENPPVVYPGNIQGRSKKESGEKGCYYVELSEHSSALEFIPLQQIRFEDLMVEATHCKKPQDLEALLEANIKQLKKQVGKCMIRLELHSDTDQVEAWLREGFIQDTIDFTNEFFEKDSEWAFIYDVKLVNRVSWNKEELKKGQHFIGELLRSFEQTTEIDGSIQPLFRHRQARKHLKQFNPEEQQEILQEAEQLLIYRLLKE